MPTYHYKCQASGSVITRLMPMKYHKRAVNCDCGGVAEQVILSAPIITIPQHMRYDWSGYESPIDGRPITNMKQRAEDMARNDCIEYDPGMKQDVDRRVKESDLLLDKLVDETIEREFDSMPILKKERLTAELEAGITAEPVRL